MASHELKNPLASITGFAQLMRRNGTYSERAVERIISQVGHMDRLLWDLLNVARLKSGQLEIVPAPVDPIELVRVRTEQAWLQTGKHTIRVEVAPDRLEVPGMLIGCAR